MGELAKEEPFLLSSEMQIFWGSGFYSMKVTIRYINVHEDSKVLPLTGEWMNLVTKSDGSLCCLVPCLSAL